MGDLVATPRNYLTGLLADAVGGVNNFASKPFGYNNPPGNMLAGLLGLPAIANTLNEASYGGALTTGKGITTKPKADTADAALGLLGLAPVANAGVNAAVRGAQRLEPAINRAVTATMDRGGFPAMALDAMANRTVSPALEFPMDEASRAARMQQMGMERGWFRGGPQIVDGKKSGDWYTPFEQDAIDFAARTPGADVREYAVPAKGILKPNLGYPLRLATDIAAKAETMGEGGQKLAQLLRSSYKDGDYISGLEAWRGLEQNLGEDDAMKVLGQLGFKGVLGSKRPQDLRVFPQTPVRDANAAKFDPARAHIDDIFGGATLPMLGLLGAGSAGAAAVVRRMKADE